MLFDFIKCRAGWHYRVGSQGLNYYFSEELPFFNNRSGRKNKEV